MIIYFSGTGNSARVAHRLASLLADNRILELAGETLINPLSTLIDVAGNSERIVWVFPTYSWGVPPVVVRFIRKCRMSDAAGNARQYMVTTCGDDMANTDKQWRKLLAARGANPCGSYAVVMPNTYTLMSGFDVDSPELSAQKLADSEESIRQVAEAIATDAPDMLVRGSFAWLKSSIIYPWFIRHAMSAKPFHATAECTSCSLCARSCPMNNITMHDGRPRWDDNCALCLRCYHICPHHAIAYGKKTHDKGQWQCPK